jgi:hypothetical protein
MSWPLGIVLALMVLMCIHIFQQPNPGKTFVQMIAGFIVEFIIQIVVPALLVLFLVFLSMKGCFK